jgi:hypothetical protein
LPAYIERGRRVQDHYQTYSNRLAEYYKALVIALRESAPDLLLRLQAPESIRHGYQILPGLISEVPQQTHPGPQSIGYSWPWTDRLIDQGWREIVRAEAELRRARALHGSQSRLVFERLALDFRKMGERHRNIDAHVHYNRFWQAAIAADRAGYDRETTLHNEVLERQGIVDGLKKLDAAFGRFSAALKRFQAPPTMTEITNNLRKREAFLTRRLNDVTNHVRTPSFVGLEHHANEWIFRVPVYTDIEDQPFVASAKKIIESAWQLQDGLNSFRVQLDISHVSTDILYADSPKPIAGQRIDMVQHLGRFPAGAAILTSGGATTHVQDYAIILGPHSMAPRVLAHEFGHILGFRDNYIRGYKDLGENGFQVMEVVADPNDIMGAPATGSVRRDHFETILKSKLGSETPIAPGRDILFLPGSDRELSASFHNSNPAVD